MKRITLGVGLTWAVLAMLSMAATARAQQTTIRDYDTARDDFFYRQFYNKGGFTLYCGAWFPVEIRRGQVHKSLGLNIEHVYPASWMKETAGCPGQTRSPRADGPRAV